MISLTHTQIAQYLKDYSRLTAYMIEPKNQMIKPFTIFKRKIYNINNTDKLNEISLQFTGIIVKNLTKVLEVENLSLNDLRNLRLGRITLDR